MFPSANLVLNMALKTFEAMQRIFDETWSSPWGRTRMTSPSGSTMTLSTGSSFLALPMSRRHTSVAERFLLGQAIGSESKLRFVEDIDAGAEVGASVLFKDAGK